MSKLTPKEVRKLWVEALESGKYKQGKMCLKRTDEEGDRYCCLGVLCDLAAKHGICGEFRDDYAGNWVFDYKKYAPPTSVLNWAGLESDIGIFGSYGPQQSSLAGINDNSSDFSAVIEIIKSEPEGLFLPDPVEVAGG